MSLHEFTAYLDRAPEDAEFELLYEAGLDDCGFEVERGRGIVRVIRESESLSSAIVSVVEELARAGFRVVGVEDEDLVTLGAVAERTGRTHESVRLLASGARGPGGFPPPFHTGRWELYSWAAVSAWLAKHAYGTSAPDERARVLAAADHLLRARELLPDLRTLARLTTAVPSSMSA